MELSIKYVMLFLTNIYSPPPCHTLLQISDPSHKLCYTFELKINNQHYLNFKFYM